MLRLKSLGQTLIEANDARVTPTAETVFATTLFLIVEAGRPVGRDELTRMIWPGVSESRAQHGLRQVLYKLKTLGATIKADRSSLILSPRFCSTDFADLLEPQPNSVLEALAANIGGSFLPGYRPDLSEQFSTWVERQRDTIHSAVARTLVAGMQARKRVSDWTGAEQFASMCLSIDPLNEEATLTVAEAAALGGSKSKALSILNNYLKDIGEDASEIKLPAALLRRRISEAYQDNVFPVRDAPFVGREEEMAELTRALARAQAGNGSAYVITGEPGIGKTRLVSEFTRVAALQRVHIVRVGCQSHDVRRPLSAFVDLVPKLLALPGALGCSPESMRYLKRLGAHDPKEARNRDEMEQTSVSDDSATQAFVDVLDAISAESCILLMLEDIQWLDEHSSRMLEEICNASSSRRALLLLTSRASDSSYESARRVALRRLTSTDSEIVANALADQTIDARELFVDWCVTSSGGNPYYLIELLRDGKRANNGYQASASLTRLLENRVQSLHPEARRLLEACCILAKHSNVERLELCLEVPRTAILQALEVLDRGGMIELDGRRVLSRHDLLSSVVLSQMSPAVKQLLHRFAATQLESESASTQSVGLIWDSAEHWLSAADAPRAVSLLRQCGKHLLDVGMPEEAARVLHRAANLATTTAEMYIIGTERLHALSNACEFAMVVESATELSALRRNLHPTPSLMDDAGLMLVKARWELGESVPMLAQQCLEDLSGAQNTPQELASAAGWLMSAADNLCDRRLAQDIYHRVSGSLRSGTVNKASRLLVELIYHSSFGDRLLALEYADELADIARLHAPPILAIRYLRYAAHVHRCHGLACDAISIGREAYCIADRIQATFAKLSLAGVIGSIYLQLGDVDSAGKWISHLESAQLANLGTVIGGNNMSYMAELAIRRGNTEVAAQLVSQTRPTVARSQATRGYVRAMALETQVRLLRGEVLSSSTLERFLQLFTLTKSASMQDFCTESLLLALEAVGQLDTARSISRSYITTDRWDACALWYDLRITVDRLLN